jgi:hypothetical protein
MTDWVHGMGVQQLDSRSDVGDKLGKFHLIKSTGQLNWWLGRISDNMFQLEHFKKEYNLFWNN